MSDHGSQEISDHSEPDEISDYYDSDDYYESEEEGAEFVFDIRDEYYFPTYSQLPEDNDLDLRYYEDPGHLGTTGPRKHWCLLVEIVQQIPYMRPMFTVKDKANNEFLVAFYLDKDAVRPKTWEKHSKTGGTIAIMYAMSHQFVDGQRGVRVEEVENINFLPCSLSTLLSIGDDIMKEPDNLCSSCKKPTSLQCSRCSVVKYCGKECQTNDWKSRHKRECVAIQQIDVWKDRDWDYFDEYWME